MRPERRAGMDGRTQSEVAATDAGGNDPSSPPARREQDAALERQADMLLNSLPRDADCPAYTEAQLAWRSRRRCVASLDAVEHSAALSAVQSFLDELAFLASVTPLTPRERLCLRGWMLGWTQREMRERWQAALPRAQQDISRCVRSALRKCCGMAGLSFAQFSRHAVYRRPSRRKEGWLPRRCPRCGEIFAQGVGSGRHCSSHCREAGKRKE